MVERAGDRYEACRDPAATRAWARADRFHAEGDDVAACAAARAAIAACPDLVPAHLLLRNAAQRAGGDLEEAMRAFYAAWPDRPTSPVPPFMRALLAQDDSVRVAALEQAIGRDRSFYYAYTELASIYRNLGRTGLALEMLQSAVAARPEYAPANVALAQVLEDLGRFAEAESYYELYVRLQPGDREAKKALVGLRVYHLGRPAAASPLIEDLLRFDPEDVEVMMDQAAVAWTTGRIDDAIAIYHRVLEVDPSRARAVLNLGNIHFEALPDASIESKQRHWPRARAAYRYFLGMDRADGLFDLADLHFAVPYRLKVIEEALGPDQRESVSIRDF
jgi:tetratricopeptide (TPR) repeat protein